jgi:hypothetical protein
MIRVTDLVGAFLILASTGTSILAPLLPVTQVTAASVRKRRSRCSHFATNDVLPHRIKYSLVSKCKDVIPTALVTYRRINVILDLNSVVCILLRVLDQVQVQGFLLTQHCLNTCLVFYSVTATCFGRMTIFKRKFLNLKMVKQCCVRRKP